MRSSAQLNILIVTPSLPFPPIWGFGIRVYQIAKHLAKTHRVSLLTYAGPEATDNATALREICHAVHTVAPPKLNRRIAQAISLLSPVSFLQSSLHSPAMQSRIDELLRTEHFDLIQVESSHLGGFQFDTRAPLVLDEHNIEYELLLRMCQTEKSPFRRLFSWAEYRKFHREEQRCWNRADGIIFTSERERALVTSMFPDKPIICGANGVDVGYFQHSEEPPDNDNIVFTGLMSYRPNIDAVQFFVSEVLPLIHRARPAVTFTIVGAGPTDEVRALAGPHVVVTDTVPDVRPFVQQAGALVIPLRMGSGTRLKVLEGLAMGKAMVSTSVGCEGISVRDGEHLLIADNAPAFARATLRVLDDRELAQGLGQKGRLLAEREYSWATIVERLENFYARLLSPGTYRNQLTTAVSVQDTIS